MGITGGMLLNPDLDKYHRVYYVFMSKQFIILFSLWRYNPVLWGVPKGSYASNPSGSCRTIEFRKMVQVWLSYSVANVFCPCLPNVRAAILFFNYLWHGPLVYCFDGVGSQLR